MRNGYRSHRGRSAIARKAIFSATGKTDGMMPQGPVTMVLWNGKQRIINPKRWGGGNKKGGAAPSATGQVRPFGKRSTISTGLAPPASKTNFLFIMKTQWKPKGNQNIV
jgi:hypothetical protein